jgi:sugar/nucleoside kinase (ribokinase family)
MDKILCIGDAMLDVVVQISGEIFYGSDTPASISTHGGGAAANTAFWLAAIGEEVFFAGRVGDDLAGLAVISQLDQIGVLHSEMIIPGAKTGTVVVLVDSSGERTMFPDSGANSGIGLADLPTLEDFKAVFLSGYSLYNPDSTENIQEVIAQVKDSEITLIFDPASVGAMTHFGLKRVQEILQQIDLLILNEEESLFLTGMHSYESALKKLAELVETVVIKLGSQGAVALSRGGDVKSSPAVNVTVVDTTGAGDAFAAGFIPCWLKTGDLLNSLQAGNQLAAKSVTIIGGRPSVNPQ